MSLLTLPPELLTNIIRKLDTKSVYNLYEAGIVCMQGLVKECHFSMNTLATAKSLRSNFFTGVSGYLSFLKLSGIPDLDLPSLINAISDMKNLKDLDVSYTNIMLTDFLQITKARPTLKSIAIDFSFDKTKRRDAYNIARNRNTDEVFKINEEMILAYQQAFEGFENVHFVGQIDEKEHGSLALRMLEKADLFSLKFTKWYKSSALNDSLLALLTHDLPNKHIMPKMSQFQLNTIKNNSVVLFFPPIYKIMDFSKYEVLLIGILAKDCSRGVLQNVVATPLVKKIICDNFDVDVSSLPEETSRLRRFFTLSWCDTILIFWDRERTTFDNIFTTKLLKIFKEHYVFNISTLSQHVPAGYQWYNIAPSNPQDSQQTVLDCGFAFSKKETIKLKIRFNENFQVNTMPTIINNFDFLKKITHLTLSGIAYYDSMFFKYLFERCDSLVTLQIALYFRISDPTLLQYLSSSKSLKNIALFGCGSDIVSSQLFSYLSECRTLENIYLYHSDGKVDSFPNPKELFRNCTNLYNLCINTAVNSATVANQMLEFYRKVAKDLGRDEISINFSCTIYNMSCKAMSNHVYSSVFKNLYQLRGHKNAS